MDGNARCSGGTGGKVGLKVENSNFSREISGNCSNFAMEG